MNEAELNAEFFAVVDSMELEIGGVKELESIDHKRDELLDYLVGYLETFDDVDTDDLDELEATLEALHLCINRDFNRMEGIALGDDIVASGETIVITIGPKESDCRTHNLADDVRLRGKIASLTVMEIPAIGAMARIMNPDITELDAENLPTNKFGIAFEIEYPVIESEYESEVLSDKMMVFLPLNYPQLHLRRLL